MKLRTAYTKNKWKGKKMDQTLNTIPDQNLSIRQLLDRHSRGLPLGASQNQGEYFDTEIPRFDDLVDMMEHKKKLVQEHKDLTKQIEKEQKAQKEKSLTSTQLDPAGSEPTKTKSIKTDES